MQLTSKLIQIYCLNETIFPNNFLLLTMNFLPLKNFIHMFQIKSMN